MIDSDDGPRPHHTAIFGHAFFILLEKQMVLIPLKLQVWLSEFKLSGQTILITLSGKYYGRIGIICSVAVVKWRITVLSCQNHGGSDPLCDSSLLAASMLPIQTAISLPLKQVSGEVDTTTAFPADVCCL